MENQLGIVQPQATDLGAEEMAAVEKLQRGYHDMKAELGKVIVGQEAVIEELLIALFCRGHALLVGVPGLAKTLLISTLAKTLGLSFSRIQFTPDLMPSDITGTEILELPLHITRLPINSVRYSLSTISSVVPVDSAIQRD